MVEVKNKGGDQMQSVINRAKHVVGGEEGASAMEIVVWILVILGIAIALFAFRDQISKFMGSATGSVGKMDSSIQKTNAKI